MGMRRPPENSVCLRSEKQSERESFCGSGAEPAISCSRTLLVDGFVCSGLTFVRNSSFSIVSGMRKGERNNFGMEDEKKFFIIRKKNSNELDRIVILLPYRS